MYAAAKVWKARFVWRVWECSHEVCSSNRSIFDLRLYYGKHTREWRLEVEWDEPTWWTNVRFTFRRVVDDKREGWELQGPVRRIY